MAQGFVLCADDFAMTLGVSKSILNLAAQKRLSATSAMANRPHWAGLARELEPFRAQLDIGLHLNLTLGSPLSAMKSFAPAGELPSIGDVTKAALMRTLPVDEIRSEIARQLLAFEDAMQAQPDFIDGHQHVHALPIIRALLIEAIARRYSTRPYLRNPGDRVASIIDRGVSVKKALGVAALARGLGQQARKEAISTNDGFAGFSAFDSTRDFAGDFKRFLRSPGRRHLVMCHPGEIDDELRKLDPVVDTRPQEARFLASAAFEAVCAEAGLKLARFTEIK